MLSFCVKAWQSVIVDMTVNVRKDVCFTNSYLNLKLPPQSVFSPKEYNPPLNVRLCEQKRPIPTTVCPVLFAFFERVIFSLTIALTLFSLRSSLLTYVFVSNCKYTFCSQARTSRLHFVNLSEDLHGLERLIITEITGTSQTFQKPHGNCRHVNKHFFSI